MNLKISKVVNKLAENPKLFIFLRKILEFNFITEKKIVKDELDKINYNDRVLDLGCGTGEFSVFFKDYSYTGIDIESNYIDFAKNNYTGKFEIMDASKMSFPDDFFDLIIVLGVFHHISDEICLKIFKEMKRVVKRNGRILIMEDLDPESRIDMLGNLLRKLDKGDFIRKEKEYVNLISNTLDIKNTFSVRSGFLKYQVFKI